MREKLLKVANMVDAKGLHSLAEQIEELAALCSPESAIPSLETLIEEYANPLQEMIVAADSLDQQHLQAFADTLDRMIELEALEQQSAIEAVLSIYKKKHHMASCKSLCRIKTAAVRKNNLPEEQRCPFGLNIPVACLNVGVAIHDMEPRKQEFKQNRRLYNAYRTGEQCPFAAEILKKQRAVNCTFGTEAEMRETPKMYRGSPIYPRLFEGFNTVNLDRNYYQYHDFSYYSLYGP